MATPNADLKKFVSEQFLNVLGKNLPALIEAVNSSAANTEQILQACIDQLFLTTASGRYLIQLGEQEGFAMPGNSGLDIRAYKLLVPVMVSNPKQVRISINDLVQAFYKNERMRPYIQAGELGPYSLNDGDNLILETETGQVSVTILASQVFDLSNVTANEIAALFNSSQSGLITEAVTDRLTGRQSLRILSATQGAGAFIRVVGGTLQNVLKFEKLAPTLNDATTTWNITKVTALNDETTFTWDGLGVNPEAYRLKKGDIVTIRGLVDGVEDFSKLNGSYEIIDVGYDYFVIRNAVYDALSASLLQPADNSIVFTLSDKVTLFDREEYAMTTETEAQTISVTVPAVPPLTLRFLKGSAHLHGTELEVLDFTRTSITVSLPAVSDVPGGDNLFVLKSDYSRYNFAQKKYKTLVSDQDPTQPTFQVDINDNNSAVLPYTVPIAISNNSLSMQIGSNEVVINFGLRHGLRRGWGVTLSGAVGTGNILAGDLNKEHIVSRVISETSAAIRLSDGLGDAINFTGVTWGPADVYRFPVAQPDQSDFYLQFPSALAALASGLTPGTVFKFDTSSGTDIDGYYGPLVRYGTYVVKSVLGSVITFDAGLGVGATGQILDNMSGTRSGSFGGNAITYHLDKTSALNLEKVFSGLRMMPLNYLTPRNEDFVGSFLYDPTGVKHTVTVSKHVVGLADNVLRGDNVATLLVDSVVDADGDPFPKTGTLVIDYGKDTFEGPIRYFAVTSSPGANQIFIDPAYKFKFSHAVGAKVQYIWDNTAYRPRIDGSDYPVYLTGTSTARKTMFELVKLLVAQGIFVFEDVIRPQLRNEDSSVVVFD